MLAGHNRSLSVLSLVAFTSVYAFIVITNGRELRGTDQYWYAADAYTLLEGKGAAAPHVFPIQVLQSDFQGNAPFIHNNLYMYLTLPLSYLFGPLTGWVLTNFLVVVTAAALSVWFVTRQAGIFAGCLNYCGILSNGRLV